jgi:hypothetical protein
LRCGRRDQETKIQAYEPIRQRFAAALQIDPNNSTALLLRQRAFNQKSSESRE